MVIQINTEQCPPIKRWYADDTKADSLRMILQNPILAEALAIIKHIHRPINGGFYSFTPQSESERSNELSRKEGIYYTLDFLEGLATIPLKEEKPEASKQFQYPDELKAKENFKPKTEKDLETLKTNTPTPQ